MKTPLSFSYFLLQFFASTAFALNLFCLLHLLSRCHIFPRSLCTQFTYETCVFLFSWMLRIDWFLFLNISIGILYHFWGSARDNFTRLSNPTFFLKRNAGLFVSILLGFSSFLKNCRSFFIITYSAFLDIASAPHKYSCVVWFCLCFLNLFMNLDLCFFWHNLNSVT